MLRISTVFACVTLSPHSLLVVDDSNNSTAVQIRGWSEGSILDELEDKKLEIEGHTGFAKVYKHFPFKESLIQLILWLFGDDDGGGNNFAGLY